MMYTQFFELTSPGSPKYLTDTPPNSPISQTFQPTVDEEISDIFASYPAITSRFCEALASASKFVYQAATPLYKVACSIACTAKDKFMQYVLNSRDNQPQSNMEI